MSHSIYGRLEKTLDWWRLMDSKRGSRVRSPLPYIGLAYSEREIRNAGA